MANSLALKLAHIDRNTPSPAGGEFVKDPVTGEPTGMLKDNALAWVEILLPRAGPKEEEQALLLAVERSLKLGLCEVHIPGNSWHEIELIRRLYGEGRIPLRIYDAISRSEAGKLFTHGPILNEFEHHFTLRAIKLYADGSLGSKSAALLAPYEGEKASGFMVTTEASTEPILQEALGKGIQIMTHAIGDAANRNMLNWYEAAFKAVPSAQRKVTSPRWRIRACADRSRLGYSSVQGAWRDSFHATIPRNRRSVLRAKPFGNGPTIRGLRMAIVPSKRLDYLRRVRRPGRGRQPFDRILCRGGAKGARHGFSGTRLAPRAASLARPSSEHAH